MIKILGKSIMLHLKVFRGGVTLTWPWPDFLIFPQPAPVPENLTKTFIDWVGVQSIAIPTHKAVQVWFENLTNSENMLKRVLV